jgi:hypothetical protein
MAPTKSSKHVWTTAAAAAAAAAERTSSHATTAAPKIVLLSSLCHNLHSPVCESIGAASKSNLVIVATFVILVVSTLHS